MMSDMERLMAKHRIETMLMDYWHDVDTNWGRNAGDYYTDDAVFIGGTATYTGVEQIKAFYQWRIDRGVARQAIHSASNLRVHFESPTQAVSTWYLILYAADGTPPLPTHPPIHMSLVTDHVVKGDDGKWRYKSRKFETWFEGGAKATNPDLSKK
jgi:hypothetical protein